jgi:nickel-dependent lactate racemase
VSTDLTFPYGDSDLRLAWPDGLKTLRLHPRPWEAPPPLAKWLRDRCADPFGRPPLAAQARGKDSCVVVVSDPREPAAYPHWLPALLDMLNGAGLADKQIKIYVANGLYAQPTREQLSAHLGPDVCSRVEIITHDPESPQMVKAGRTDLGTHVHLHSLVLDSPLLILTSAIHYDWLLGYCGGPGLVLPGMSGRESLDKFYSRAIDRRTGELAASVKAGVSLTNPLSDDSFEACAVLKPSFAVSLILGQNGEVLWLNAGDAGYLHRQGIKELDQHHKAPVSAQPDIAIVGIGGAPLDHDLEKVAGELWRLRPSLKPGSDVVVVAECGDGEGALAPFRQQGLGQIRARLLDRVSPAALSAAALRQLSTEFKLHLVSKLPAEVLADWGINAAESLERCVNRLMPARPDQAHFLICESAHNLLPSKDVWRSREGGATATQRKAG